MELVEGLLVAALVVVLLLGVIAFLTRNRPSPALRPKDATPKVVITVDLTSPHEEPEEYGEYPFQIVGESYYQEALRDIVENSADPGPNWPFKGARCKVWAQLVFEDTNPYDPMAVRVDVDGRTVGYFSRADARRYRAMLDAPVPLPAVIVGGWDHGDRRNRPGYDKPKGSFGVRLALQIKDESLRS